MRSFLKKSARHSSLLALEIVAVIVTLVVILWLGLLLRLSQAPLPLKFIAGPLQKTINANIKNYHIEIAQTQLSWGGYGTPLQLELNTVEIQDKETHTPILLVSKVGIEASKKALLVGKIKPRSLSVYDTALRFIRNENGKITLRALSDEATDKINEDGNDTQPHRNPWVDTLDAILSSDDDNDKDLFTSDLRALRIINADIVLQDNILDQYIKLDNARIALKRNNAAMVGVMEGDVKIGEASTTVISNFHYNVENETTRLLTRFDGFELARILDYFPENLTGKTTLEGAVDGALFLLLNKDLEPIRLRVNVSGDKGRIASDKLFQTDLNYDDIAIKSNYSFVDRTFTLEEFSLKSSSLNLDANATTRILDVDKKNYDLVLHANLSGLNVDDLKIIWPDALAPLPREWVTENISKGVVDYADVNISAHTTPDNAKKLNLDRLNGRIAFKNSTVKYLSGFPAISNVDGVATYTKDTFAIETTGGTYKDLKVQNASILIDSFKVKPAHIAVKMKTDTTLKTALEIIDSDPFNYATKAELPVQNISGMAHLDLDFKVPLMNNPPLDQIKVNVRGDLTNVTWKDLTLGQALTQGKLKIGVDTKRLSLVGSGQFNQYPITIDWFSQFNAPTNEISTLKAKTTLHRATIAPFLPKDDILVEGDIPISLLYQQYKDNTQKASVTANLKSSSFLIPMLDLQKPIGTEGNMSFDISFKDKKATALKNLDVKTPELTFKGTVALKQTSDKALSWTSGQFTNVRFKHNDITLNIDRAPSSYTLKIGGQTLDMSSILKRNSIVTAPSENLEPLVNDKLKMRVSAEVKNLMTNDAQTIKNAKIFMDRDSYGLINHFELTGVAGRGQLYLKYLPTKNDKHSFRLEADDAGAALKSLNISNSVRGGTLIVDGRPNPDGGSREMMGQIQISNFALVKAPLLTRLLGAMSLSGLDELLSGDGMGFTRMKADFYWYEFYKQNGVIDRKHLRIKEGRTSGSSLGLTFDGTLDFLQKTIDSKGTIVPVSGVSKVVGEIPILGDLLTGGGKGIFAATYTIKGNIANPTVIVNPLAALAPGILRTIFFEGN